MESNKWIMFKNYMHNELGITKEDISGWVADAVMQQATRVLSEYNISERIDQLVSAKIDNAIKDRSLYTNKAFNDEIMQKVSRELASSLRLTIRE